MKIIYLLVSGLMLFSCIRNQEKNKKEFYSNGVLRSKVQVDSDGVLNGLYEEYYINKKIKTKGTIKNGLKLGWWKFYDSLGNISSEKEYLVLRDSIYKNQVIFYDKNGDIRRDLSSFYKMEFPDTITLGKNIGRIRYNSNFIKAREKFLQVIIDNQYSDFEVKKDTFVEDFNNTRFGVFAHKKGIKVITGTIIEKLVYVTEINKDSSELIIKTHEKYFEKEVYVKDSTNNKINPESVSFSEKTKTIR